MAKKKRKGSRRRRGKSKKSRASKAKPGAAGVGAVATGFDLIFEPDKKYGGTVADYAKNVFKGTQNLTGLGNVAKSKLTDLNSYKWLAIGVGVSASKNLPIINLVARPVDRVIKKMTKGKLGL